MTERKEYNTKQRNAVLSCFEKQPQRSMTAQEVYRQIRQDGVAIGRTTVFRTIASLCEKGRLITLTDLHSTSPTRYQHRGQQKHINVRCSGCGLIAALDCSAVNEFEQHLVLDHGFRLQEEECLLPGLCRDCQQ